VMDGSGMGGGAVFVVILLIVIGIPLIVWAIASSTTDAHDQPLPGDMSGITSTTGMARHQTPREILAERYAKGEIDSSEYQRRLRVLTNREDRDQ
jgi:putative membrane protein